VEQRFREARFAGARVAYEGNGPECFGGVFGHGLLLQRLYSRLSYETGDGAIMFKHPPAEAILVRRSD
jgi:hypothetical protein